MRHANPAVTLLLAPVLIAAGLLPGSARADCALLPAAVQQLPSTSGRTAAPIALPGATVTLFAEDECDGAAGQPFFAADPAENEVTLIFEPPGGGSPTSFTPFASTSASECDTPSSPGDAQRCYVLEFVVPDTTNFGPMAGTGQPLTGPARIEVRNTAAAGNPVVAEIGPLFEPTRSCDGQNRFLHPFEHFTVLPPKNTFSDTTTQLRATVDGSGALIVPFDYSGVLAGPSGSATLRILSVDQALDDGLDADPATLAVLPQNDDGFISVQALSVDGRPIPPLLEVNAEGDGIIGSVDFVDSVVRFAPANANGAPVFDYTGALLNGSGPLLLGGATGATVAGTVSLGIGGVAQLNSLNSRGSLAALALDESLSSDINLDLDAKDQIAAIIDTDLGLVFSTDRAVTELDRGSPKPVIANDGALVAILQSEAREGNTSSNPDGDVTDSVVQLFWVIDDGGGPDLEQLTSGDVRVEASTRINGDGPIAIAGNTVFFSRNEQDELGTVSSGPYVADASVDSLSDTALSGNGRMAGTEIGFVGDSPSPGVLVYFDTAFGTTNFLSVVPGQSGCSGLPTDGNSLSPTFSDFGLDAAFQSDATVFGGSGPSHVYLADLDSTPPPGPCLGLREPVSVVRVSQNRATLIEGDADSSEPEMSGNAGHLVFVSEATNLLSGGATSGEAHIFVYDIANDVIELLSRTATGTESDDVSSAPTISKTGRFVAFASVASNLVSPDANGFADIFVVDRDANEDGIFDQPVDFVIERISDGLGGAAANGDSKRPSISDDGRFVAFDSLASNLVAGDANFATDVFVHDREADRTVRLSVSTEGAGIFGANSQTPAISGDGRRVVFESDGAFVSDDTNGTTDIYRVDRLTRVVERVNVGAAEPNAPSTRPVLTSDGRGVAFQTTATNILPGDGNGREDLVIVEPAAGTSLNPGDSDTDDVVLWALTDDGSQLNPDLELLPNGRIGEVEFAAADGRSLSIRDDDSDDVFIWEPPAAPVFLGGSFDEVALSDQAACWARIDAFPLTFVGDPAQLVANGTAAREEITAFDAVELKAVANRCVIASDEPSLHVVTLTPVADNDPVTPGNQPGVQLDDVDICLPAVDFQVAPEGVAFRTCEFDLVPPTDGNGDGDTDDCNINFWDFSVPVDETCDPDPLIETGFSAVPCTIDGCDPFFEPYRLLNGRLSFTTRESDLAPGSGGSEENDGGGGRSPNCLPTLSDPDQCDLNADQDNEDLVVVVIPLASCSDDVCKRFIFTPDPEGGTIPPFPDENGSIVIVDDGDVKVLGDADGDASPDADGVTDPDYAESDSCPNTPNPDQLDADADGLGAVCDGAAGDGNPQDNPGQSLCDLNRSGTITISEVTQVFDDRGVDILGPSLAGAPRDNRDPDADGVVTVLDGRICSLDCAAQVGGCAAAEPSAGCGLLGIEGLGLLALRRRRGRRSS